MFTRFTTVKIEKDGNFAKYMKIVRNYDNSIGMSQIKKAIDSGEVVFSFDPKNNPIIHNGKNNTDHFLETYFVKTLRELKKAGAKLTVHDGWGINEEFSYGYKRNKPVKPRNEKSNEDVMAEINAKWKLPKYYIKFLQSHAKTNSYEIEDKDTYERTEISLYGADNIIEFQDGYSWNAESGEVFSDWNKNFIVIADIDADPFCIDISRIDSPVYFAEHGMDEWDFDEYCESFEVFLKILGV